VADSVFGGKAENGLSLAAGEVSCNADPGASCQSSLRAQPIARLYEGGFKWSESAGTAVVRDVNRIKQSDGSWLFHIDYKNALAAGVYRGSVTIRFDSFSPFGDTINPVSFNYTLTVAALNGNLTPLSRITNDWEGFNGNGAHTGFVPLTLDPASFTRRFSRVSPDNTHVANMALADGKLFLISHDVSKVANAPVNPLLQGLREADNTQALRVAGSPAAYYLNLAASAQQVLVTSSESSGRLLSSFDSSSGALRYTHNDSYSRLVSSSNVMAPTVAGGMVCANNGTDGELQCLDAASGALLWRASLRSLVDPVYQDTAPAISDTQVLTNQNATFSAFNRANGSLVFSLPVPGPASGSIQTTHLLNQAVVAVDANSALLLDRRNNDGTARDNTLSMVDLATRKIRWQAAGQFTAHPVAAQGVVYVGNQKTQALEARDVTSGALLWSWALPLQDDDGFGENLVVTNNLLFVPGKHNTYAIDLATHQSRWSYHFAGKLALSSQGVLYILGPDQDPQAPARDWVVAINLK
jgi:outer membrane protein assembly factor BamB